MHRKFQRASELTGEVIAAAIEVHRHFGPGLLESIYEWALMRELELRGLNAVCQKGVTVHYKGAGRLEELKFDVLVEDCLMIEAKAVEKILPIHKAQLLSYMKLIDAPLGLLMNFHDERLVDGIARMLLPGANRDAP